MADLQHPSTPRPSQSNSSSWENQASRWGTPAYSWWANSQGKPPPHPKTTPWLAPSFLVLLAALLGLIGLGGIQGCAGLAGPNWRHPGTAQTQQLRALRFDPYPEDDLGPSVEGARPMEFQNPPPDIQRSRPHELRRRWFPWQTTPP